MDRGGCSLSGGGGGERQASERQETGSQSGMITLEELESLSEDQILDSGNGSLEEGEIVEGEQDRLLHYWQDIARGHRVEVPRDMAEPIQQLTTNNNGTHNRETVPFTLISRKEKVRIHQCKCLGGAVGLQCGDVLYEKRNYKKAYWACITVKEETYEQSICYGFMRIMRYICQQNSLGSYLGMTLPIVTVLRTNEMHTTLSGAVTVAYYLPSQHQAQPPQPYDTGVVIEQWPATIVYTRAFTGATNETIILNEINILAELLDSPELYVTDSFIVASYTNPAAANRENEMWFFKRP